MNAVTLSRTIAVVCRDLFAVDITVAVDRPDEQFGDFATNVALQLAGKVQINPRHIAETVAEALRQSLGDQAKEVTIAGPGFINIRLSNAALLKTLQTTRLTPLAGQEILVEFGDPNPFKAMHLGHLYTTVAGDAISRLLERRGATVKRLSYHGDVGMHVAKAMWALLRYEGNDLSDVLQSEIKIGAFYAQGATAYKEDLQAKAQIIEINRKIYELRLHGQVVDDNTDGRLKTLYDIGYKNSFAAFNKLFDRLGVVYEKRYVESQSTELGMQYVKQHIGTVFEESEGAIIYRGEKVGLHTRVFINSQGLPTYEAKDLGLVQLKHHDYPYAAQSIIITANEQTDYFKVMLAALREIDPALAAKTRHIAHGFLSLHTGKMSSRHGIQEEQMASGLLRVVEQTVAKQFPHVESDVQQAVYLAAVKYTFLKSRIGQDIIFNVKESMALEGNSGPYLQYAHARARSILRKLQAQPSMQIDDDLQPNERSFARKLSEYEEVLQRAATELLPHHICTYLYELAQGFNRFYEKNRVVDDPRQDIRAHLVQIYADTLKDGLEILGIQAPERL